MFEGWGFLLTEIFVLLAVAALFGLVVGWLIWGRRSDAVIDTSEADRLHGAMNGWFRPAIWPQAKRHGRAAGPDHPTERASVFPGLLCGHAANPTSGA